MHIPFTSYTHFIITLSNMWVLTNSKKGVVKLKGEL